MASVLANALTVLRNPRMGAAWARWVLGTPLVGPPAVRLPGGGIIGGFASFTDCWGFRGPTPAECRLIERTVPSHGVALDVGANAGAFAISIGMLRPAATVHAFEPVPRAYEMLTANLARNKVHGVTPYNVAVGVNAGNVMMTAATTGSATNHVATAGEEGILVPSVSLDEFLAEHKINEVDFLKIDVEGYEPFVLRGLAATLAAGRVGTMLIEVIPELLRRQGVTVGDVLGPLHSHGYRLYELAEDGCVGEEMTEAKLTAAAGWNFVACRPVAE